MLRPADRLRVAVLTTTRAPGLKTLLSAGENDAFQLVGVMATDPCATVLPDTREAGIPCVVHDLAATYRAKNRRRNDLTVRQEFDAATATILARWQPDLVALSGYIHILTQPMLSAYRDCLISIHDSDLTLRDAENVPRYRGLHATLDAVRAGEHETRSTVHVVRAEVDMGPALLLSRAFPVYQDLVGSAREEGAVDILKAYAYAQREWMMRAVWGSMLHAALTLYADDGVELLGNHALVRGMPGPLQVHPRDEVQLRHRAGAVGAGR